MSQFLVYVNYLSLEKKYSPHTVTAYTKDLQVFSDFCSTTYDSHLIQDCNYSQIRSWIVRLLENGVGNRTVNRKVASLKSYYKFLLKTGHIQVSPLLKHKALKVSKKVQVPFSGKEMSDVLSQLEFEDTFEGKRDRLMIELFYATGMRKAELIGLKVSDIDLNSGTVKVLGKRNKERIIPLIASLEDRILDYLDVREGVVVDDGVLNLFLTSKGAKVYDSLVYRIINLYFSILS